MDPAVRRIYQILILGGIGLLFLLMAIATPMVLDTTNFSMYNSGWNGCSDIAVKTYKAGRLQPTFYFDQNELTITPRSFAEYPVDAHNSTILIIGPRANFSTSEGVYIKNFLKDGGLLLLADDFGTGNDLLKKINATSRFTQGLLLDLSFEKKASFVTVFDVKNRTHPLTINVTHLLLNYPTGLILGKKNTTLLIVTSEVSWLDKNLDGTQNTGEKRGPFPVLAIEKYGAGQIVLLSDPSILINSMKDQLDNNIFRENLFHYLFMGRDTVIIDESHRDSPLLLHLSYMLPSTISIQVKIAIVLLVIAAFIVGFTRIPRSLVGKLIRLLFRRKETPEEKTVDQMINELLARHPTWNRKKVEDLIRELK